MLTPNILRTAIVLCLRAPLKGEEARDTVAALDALAAAYKAMTTPPPAPEEETDGNDAQPSK